MVAGGAKMYFMHIQKNGRLHKANRQCVDQMNHAAGA